MNLVEIHFPACTYSNFFLFTHAQGDLMEAVKVCSGLGKTLNCMVSGRISKLNRSNPYNDE